jgi:hypothetical protein
LQTPWKKIRGVINPLEPPRHPVVHICGYGLGYDIALAKMDSGEEGEWWCCNPMGSRAAERTWDRWFELHDREMQEERHGEMYLRLKDLPATTILYLQEAHEDYPQGVAYPREEVNGYTVHGWHHCGTFDWMCALAVMLGFDRIEFHGVLLQTGEPAGALACLQYWCGVAEGQGAVVEHEGWSDLFCQIAAVGSRADQALLYEGGGRWRDEGERRTARCA